MALAPPKCVLEVRAGKIPGREIAEYTRVWAIALGTDSAAFERAYQQALHAAIEYACSLQEPQKLHWVDLKWSWVPRISDE